MKKLEYLEVIDNLRDFVKTHTTLQDEFLTDFINDESERVCCCFGDADTVQSLQELKEYFDYRQGVWKYENNAHFPPLFIDYKEG